MLVLGHLQLHLHVTGSPSGAMSVLLLAVSLGSGLVKAGSSYADISVCCSSTLSCLPRLSRTAQVAAPSCCTRPSNFLLLARPGLWAGCSRQPVGQLQPLQQHALLLASAVQSCADGSCMKLHSPVVRPDTHPLLQHQHARVGACKAPYLRWRGESLLDWLPQS